MSNIRSYNENNMQAKTKVKTKKGERKLQHKDNLFINLNPTYNMKLGKKTINYKTKKNNKRATHDMIKYKRIKHNFILTFS